jgi:putative DNA primase/helicase
MRVADVARIWQGAGVSIIPILDNQTKRPAFRWSAYQAVAPSLDQVDEWWGNGKPYGLALICGAVSGNLEMTEIEGRAMASEKLIDIINRMDELGVGYVWDLLYGPEGFTETSPSGGLHFLYRISDHEVPGNTKIAANGEGLCLAETRGHGGYVITAPTPGICHPSGEPWILREGQYGVLPTLTWQERNLFHEALRLALDESAPTAHTTGTSPVSASLILKTAPSSAVGEASRSPGDDFEAHTDWAEILEPHGWSLESRHGPERHWTRPGKERREGASATTGRAGDRDRLYVFSTSTVFQTEVPYTKFGAYALLNHGGDHRAAAQELVRLGFGEQRTPVTLDAFIVEPPVEAAETTDDDHSCDDVGNGMRLAQRVRNSYRYVWEEKRFYRWDGAAWQYDFDGGITREMVGVTDALGKLAKEADNEALAKWAKASRSASKVTAAISLAKTFGLTHSAGEWNPNRHLLNVRNGVLDLHTGELHPHDRSYLMTNMFGASYDPQAECPEFESFMARALPDERMRGYVQRALGYSLLGDADQRSMFLIFGPSGTGKSTLMDTMRELFAGYGITAPAGTFRAQRGDRPSNDLHALKGRRFVATSETAESATFDEEMLKRLTGRDQVQSRALYQEYVEWVPEFTLWLATNHMPKFNSDDDALWKRTKMIPFNTVFLGDGQVPDMARRVLIPEADGILNWLLAGLHAFLAGGLEEPEEVRELAKEQRAMSDSVARFMDERVTDGWLVEGPDNAIKTSELYAMYMEWSRQLGERCLSNRRFVNRVQSHYPDLTQAKVSGHLFWQGIGRNQGTWLIGRRELTGG